MSKSEAKAFLKKNPLDPRAMAALQELAQPRKPIHHPPIEGGLSPKSHQQEHLLQRIKDLRLPRPKVEHTFHPTRQWRFDLAWPEYKVAVECEGIKRGKKSRHTTNEGYAADAEKYNAAIELGWFVLRYVPAQIYDDSAVEQIRRVLRQKGAPT